MIEITENHSLFMLQEEALTLELNNWITQLHRDTGIGHWMLN